MGLWHSSTPISSIQHSGRALLHTRVRHLMHPSPQPHGVLLALWPCIHRTQGAGHVKGGVGRRADYHQGGLNKTTTRSYITRLVASTMQGSRKRVQSQPSAVRSHPSHLAQQFAPHGSKLDAHIKAPPWPRHSAAYWHPVRATRPRRVDASTYISSITGKCNSSRDSSHANG